MVVWILGNYFKCANAQRARILAVDPERKTLVVRSCGDPNTIAEVPMSEVRGVEVSDNLAYFFTNPTIRIKD